MTFQELLKQCESGNVGPLYLLHGTEQFLHQEALNALRKTVPDEVARTEISVAAEGMFAVLSIANQYPMFSPRQLVIARDFEKLDDNELDALKDYLKDPQPTTTLVFQAETLDKRRNVSTALLKGCAVLELNQLRDRDAIEWVNGYLRQAGYQMHGNTIGLLLGLTGTDLFTLRNELDKLMAKVGKPGLIPPADVEQLVARAKEHSNFELADALLANDLKKSLRLLTRLLDDRAEPIMLLGIIARVFRQMLIAKDLMKQPVQAPPNEIAREIGIPPFRIADFLTHTRRWEEANLVRAVKRMATVDDALKNSLGKPDLQLEFLICELLGQ